MDTDPADTAREPHADRAENGVKCMEASDGWQPPESRRGMTQGFLSESLEGTTPDDTLILDFWPPQL